MPLQPIHKRHNLTMPLQPIHKRHNLTMPLQPILNLLSPSFIVKVNYFIDCLEAI